MSEPRCVGEVVRVAFWEQGLRAVNQRPGLTPDQRERWRAVYELEVGRARGEGVTREECGRAMWRTLVWDRLQSKLPTEGVPREPGFLRYMLVRRDILRAEGVSQLEAAAAFKAGHDAYYRWWGPIERELVFCERAVVALHVLGGSQDAPEMRRLLGRGDNVARAVSEWQDAGELLWAPRFVWRCHPADEWFRAHGNVGRHTDAVAWWLECRGRAGSLVPGDGSWEP